MRLIPGMVSGPSSVLSYMAVKRRLPAVLGLTLLASLLGVVHPPTAVGAPAVPDKVQIEDPRGDAHRPRAVATAATYVPEADMYVCDQRTNRMSVANNSYDGSESVGYIWDVDLAATARRAFFTSYDSNLVPGDTNLDSDVFKYSFR